MRPILIPALTGFLALSAGAASAQETSVFRENDASMTCAQIGDEAAQLSQAMGERTPSGGWLSSLGNLAKAGAAMVIPGGGLAVAGVDAVRQPGEAREQADQAAVQNRWYYLNGLHAGRGCREQTQAASAQPPAAAEPAPTLATPQRPQTSPTLNIQPATMTQASGDR